MGEVLAMKPVLLIIAGLALFACGSETDQATATAVKTLVTRLTSPKPAPVDVRRIMTPDVLAQIHQPFVIADIPSRKASASMVVSGRNNDYVTWIAGDGISLTFHNGLLTATRGIGGDLMASDIAQSDVALRAGGGNAVRVHRYIDAENHIRLLQFTCQLRRIGFEPIDLISRQITATVTEETCQADTVAFTNRYWTEPAGNIVKSEQWINPEVGYVDLLRVVQ